MTNIFLRREKVVLLTAVLVVLLGPWTGHADSRVSKMVNLLDGSPSYRVRVQAAAALGDTGATEAVPVLLRLTEDESDLVVISAALALGKIGDCSVISDLEEVYRKSNSTAAKSQLKATLRILWTLSKKEMTRAEIASGHS
jgi:HEAT repeat protein